MKILELEDTLDWTYSNPEEARIMVILKYGSKAQVFIFAKAHAIKYDCHTYRDFIEYGLGVCIFGHAVALGTDVYYKERFNNVLPGDLIIVTVDRGYLKYTTVPNTIISNTAIQTTTSAHFVSLEEYAPEDFRIIMTKEYLLYNRLSSSA
jgi:hypothetical protein